MDGGLILLGLLIAGLFFIAPSANKVSDGISDKIADTKANVRAGIDNLKNKTASAVGFVLQPIDNMSLFTLFGLLFLMALVGAGLKR